MSRIWSELTESLRYLAVSCTQVPVRKLRECLPTGCLDIIELFLPPWCVGGCIEVWPFHTTNAEPMSAARAAVEAPIYALHQPLPASKTISSL